MNNHAALLWVDLEMTGLDADKDNIVEVAAIATDWDFREIGRYEAVVQVDEAHMKSRMVGDFWDNFSEVRDALQAQNKTGKPIATVEQELLSFIKTCFPSDLRPVLAGNSIHQDRKFIDRELPELSSLLHYRMLDVSAWKLVFDAKYHITFRKPESHRALDDIVGSIEELQYYLKKAKINDKTIRS